MTLLLTVAWILIKYHSNLQLAQGKMPGQSQMSRHVRCRTLCQGRADNPIGHRKAPCVLSLQAFNPRHERWTLRLNAAPDVVCTKPTLSRSIIISACFLYRCCESNKASRSYTVGDASSRSGLGRRHHLMTARRDCAVNAVGAWKGILSIARTVVSGNKKQVTGFWVKVQGPRIGIDDISAQRLGDRGDSAWQLIQ